MAFQPAQPASSHSQCGRRSGWRPFGRRDTTGAARPSPQRPSAWHCPIAAHTGGRRPEPDLQSTSIQSTPLSSRS